MWNPKCATAAIIDIQTEFRRHETPRVLPQSFFTRAATIVESLPEIPTALQLVF